MKLISLNTWGGKYFEPLIKFIKEDSASCDIFCFQEVLDTNSKIKSYKTNKGLIRANLLYEIRKILPDYQSYYFPIMQGYANGPIKLDFDIKFGEAIFIKKSLKIKSYDKILINKPNKVIDFLKKDLSNLPVPLQIIQLDCGKIFSIFNFHGTPAPAEKMDTPKRLSQSKKVKEIIDKTKGGKILVGDFNLSKSTKSIKLFEDDMINLIKKFDIEKTRSKLSPFYGKSNFQKFADYTFVSKNVEVENFDVPDVKISDHLPMVLEFS